MPILVAYGPERGGTEGIAEMVADERRGEGSTVDVTPGSQRPPAGSPGRLRPGRVAPEKGACHSSRVTHDRGVGSWIERRARASPDRVAVLHGTEVRTYGALAGRIRRLARGLQALGVTRGDRVGWLGANHPAFLESLFAAATLGAALAPVNHRLDHSVIRMLLADYSPRAVVVDSSGAGVELPPGVPARIGLDASTGAEINYEELIASASDEPIDAATRLDDVCLVPHTSGTVGPPRGVMLTHGNLTWNVVNLLTAADFRSDDVTIAIAPFFRTGGIGVNVLPVLSKGGTVVVPEVHGPRAILELIERHRATIGFGNPDLLEALMRSDRWQATDLSRIRFFITGGAPVPESVIRAYLDRGVTFLQGYGLSEAAPVALLLDASTATRKVGSAGKPPLFVDVRVVGSDGNDLAPNQIGELLVSGPNVMAGYWNRPEATRKAIDGGGWLHTGDAARIDDDGDVWIVDRVGNAYESSGHTVYPGEVERILTQHPTVAEAAVAAREGRAKAFVVLEPATTLEGDELLEHCRRRLPAHAIPSEITVVDRLPRSSVGKLLRHELA